MNAGDHHRLTSYVGLFSTQPGVLVSQIGKYFLQSASEIADGTDEHADENLGTLVSQCEINHSLHCMGQLHVRVGNVHSHHATC
jgi:hypothetical protein